MSPAGTPLALRFITEEKEKPVMASTLPCASMGSRTGKPTFSIFTFAASIPFCFTKMGHCA